MEKEEKDIFMKALEVLYNGFYKRNGIYDCRAVVRRKDGASQDAETAS